MKNIVKLDPECSGECPVGGCGKNAYPYSLNEGGGGYVDTCRDHVVMAIQECLDDGTMVVPAAACPRCWGWTSFGGMSHAAFNKCECHNPAAQAEIARGDVAV